MAVVPEVSAALVWRQRGKEVPAGTVVAARWEWLGELRYRAFVLAESDGETSAWGEVLLKQSVKRGTNA